MRMKYRNKGCFGRFVVAFLLACLAYSVLSSYIEKNYASIASAPANRSDVVLPTETLPTQSGFQAKEAPIALLEDIEKTLEAEFPRNYKLKYDESTNALDIGIFISQEDYWDFYEKSFNTGDVSDWYGFLGNVEDVTNEIQESWRDAGFWGSAFVVNILRAEKTNNIIVATFANGNLVLDKIDALAASSLEINDIQKSTISHSYVVNTNTKVFHRPTCSVVKNINSENKSSSSSSREDLIVNGYSPCQICNP